MPVFKFDGRKIDMAGDTPWQEPTSITWLTFGDNQIINSKYELRSKAIINFAYYGRSLNVHFLRFWKYSTLSRWVIFHLNRHCYDINVTLYNTHRSLHCNQYDSVSMIWFLNVLMCHCGSITSFSKSVNWFKTTKSYLNLCLTHCVPLNCMRMWLNIQFWCIPAGCFHFSGRWQNNTNTGDFPYKFLNTKVSQLLFMDGCDFAITVKYPLVCFNAVQKSHSMTYCT